MQRDMTWPVISDADSSRLPPNRESTLIKHSTISSVRLEDTIRSNLEVLVPLQEATAMETTALLVELTEITARDLGAADVLSYKRF